MKSLLKAARRRFGAQRLSCLPISILILVGCTLPAPAQAQFPGRGDDVTPSLGQFNLVVDPRFERVVESNPGYEPYLSHKGGNLNFTSPILFDPTTTIGRSDPLISGSTEDDAGVLAGIQAPRLLQDALFTIRPSFAEGPDGTREVHTFIQSIHLTGAGFEVKAGNQAPLRPLSAGEVESLSGNSGDAAQDFPASSFFDVFVEVVVPALGGFPSVQLVNVDPLLVQSESISSFPPKVLYVHGNSSAVPLYFYKDIASLGIQRGDLFGQLTLAGHGVGFRQSDVAEFEAAETESETHHGHLPLQSDPTQHVIIVDAAALCVGDCSNEGEVTIDELLTLVNIALGEADISTCSAGIASEVTEVTVDLIITAVNNALNGCS